MFTRETKIGLIATFSTMTAFAFSSNAIPPLVTTIANDFHIEYATFGGYVVMLQFTFFALASLCGGWAAHRFGFSNRSLVITGILFLAILLMAGSTFPNFKWFIFWAIPLGFAGGLVETFGAIMICRFGGPQSSKMLNFGQVFFCLGAIIAPTLIAFILGYGFSWRVSFLGLGILILVIGIWFIYQTRTLKEPTWEMTDIGHKNSDAFAPTVKIPLLSDPLLYYLCGALFTYVAVEGSIIVWVASYFEKNLGLPAKDAAWRLSVYWAGMLLGRSLILLLRGRWTLWPALLAASTGMMLSNIVLSFKWGPLAATILVLVGGLLAGPLWPTIVTMSQQMRNSSAFTSCVIGIGALGAAFGPLSSSYVIKYLGTKYFFPILAAEGVVLITFILKARSYKSS
ncbi:MAG: MFS transporter [Phycisphaerae bacterium]